MHTHDTIVAVSSPPGRSARGLIRVSGPGVGAVLDHVLNDARAAARALTPVRLRRPDLPALLLRFPGPASYTGDDLAELQLPGHAALLDRALHDMIDAPDANARLAEPGEFTFRAYAAGKLDLTQAEGVGATIAAVSDGQLAAARLLRRGRLGRTAQTLVDQLGNLLALVESGIDFTDQEDVTPIATPELDKRLSAILREMQSLLSRSRSWGALESLPRVVLVGPPSAGKSTLFNALLGRERAVIDAAPGTTRDALAEPLRLQGADNRPAEAMLVDLAGLDEALADDAPLPDRGAQQAARDAVARADLIVRVTEPGRQTIAINAPAHVIDVLSKSDTDRSTNQPASNDSPRRELGGQTTKDANPHLAAGAGGSSRETTQPIRVSAQTGEGLDALRRAIVHALAGQAVSVQADLLALQPRHEHALRQAADQLHAARDTLAPALGSPRLPDIELLADAMRAALDALASLGGHLTPDEVIGRVFATFCVGK
ncbi:MAG: tRNA modification GTPase [Phycisphaeraceae bacterium]